MHSIIPIMKCSQVAEAVVLRRAAAFEALKALVLDSLTSEHSRLAYDRALNAFLNWFQALPPGSTFTKSVVQRYVAYLRDLSLSPSTINLRLTAVRRLASEAGDAGLMEHSTAEAVRRVKGVKQKGVRTGRWLTGAQAEELLAAPDGSTLKGKRDRALIAVMIGCGLRRSEASALLFENIQIRDDRWVIVDLVGKGRRLRTVPMPLWAKTAIDDWSRGAAISSGKVFRSLRVGGQLGDCLLPQNILGLVIGYGNLIGVRKLAPHDLRRTFARLAYDGQANLKQIQLSLGHASISTTERYLGVAQDLRDAPCDHLGLRARRCPAGLG